MGTRRACLLNPAACNRAPCHRSGAWNLAEPASRSDSSGTDERRTAERIGSAVGNAQRQFRRGLELVSSGAVRLSRAERERLSRAAGTVHNIGDKVGQKTVRGFDQWGEAAKERLQQLRCRLTGAPSRLRQVVTQYPLQTIAAIAAASFAVGAALRLTRRSNRG